MFAPDFNDKSPSSKLSSEIEVLSPENKVVDKIQVQGTDLNKLANVAELSE